MTKTLTLKVPKRLDRSILEDEPWETVWYLHGEHHGRPSRSPTSKQQKVTMYMHEDGSPGNIGDLG